MENKILTPVMLWQGFNNQCCPLDINIVSYSSIDGISVTEYYFTALEESDGSVRTFVRTYRLAHIDRAPVMIMIEEFDKTLDEKLVLHFASLGYIVMIVDYKGKKLADNYTHYPASLSYGNIVDSGEHLNTAKYGAQNTCLYLWSKLIRRAITFALSMPTTDGKVVLYGAGSAVNILAQVAGMDSRVSASIIVRNNGHCRFNANTLDSMCYRNIEDEVERNMWIIGCAALSYSKFIKAPILLFASTNDPIYDIMALPDTLSQIDRDVTTCLSISTGTTGALYDNFYPTAEHMLKCILDGKTVEQPALSHSVEDGSIYYSCKVDSRFNTVDRIELAVTYGNCPSTVRNWHRYTVSAGMDGAGRIPIRVYSATDKVHAILTVYYNNGVMLSSSLYTIDPCEYAGELKVAIPNNRIIFDKHMGTTPFYINSRGLTAAQSHIILRSGALDIIGVTTDIGDLVTYRIGDIVSKNADSILLFDCYSIDARDIIVRVTDINFDTYSAHVHIDGSHDWTRISLVAADFKNEAKRTLRTFEDIKALAFSDIENVLLNNIILI